MGVRSTIIDGLKWAYEKSRLQRLVNSLSTIVRGSQVTNFDSSASGNPPPAWMDISTGVEDGIASSSTTNSVGESAESDKPPESITPRQNRAKVVPLMGDLSQFDSLEETTAEVYSTTDLPGAIATDVKVGLLTGVKLSVDNTNTIENIYNAIAGNINNMPDKGTKALQTAEQDILQELQNSRLTIDELNQLYNVCKQDGTKIFPGFKRRLLTSIEKSIMTKKCDNIVFEIDANSTKTKRSDDDIKDVMFQYIVECMRQGGSIKEVKEVMGTLRNKPYNVEFETADWLRLFNAYCKDGNLAENSEQLIEKLTQWIDKVDLNKAGSNGSIHFDFSVANQYLVENDGSFEKLSNELTGSINTENSKFAALVYYMVNNIVQKYSLDDITNYYMLLSQNIENILSLDGGTTFNPAFGSSQPVVLPEKPLKDSASNTPVEPENPMQKAEVDKLGNFSPKQPRKLK